MTSCDHPIHVGGMCAKCGAILSDVQQSQAISMMHDTESVTVSRQEALRLDSESTRHLLEQRKLALIVDLDQTIIHATVDPTVGEWLKSPENPNYQALKGVGAFRLGMDGKAVLEDGTGIGSSQCEATESSDDEGCWYYVKPRPGLPDFLKSLSERYELHVYTMGTRSYADCVCKVVDPDGSLFGTRILSRDENGSLVSKSLSRLFPMDTSMVVIIDDRGDVWSWSPNLVKVIPYDFFIGSGDINATFLPAATGPIAHSPPASDPTSSSGSPLSLTTSSDPTTATTSSPPSSQSSSRDQLTTTTEQLNDAAEKEEAAADTAAKVKAEESQKSAVTEQLGLRPLAKMQEKLDEELGVTPAASEIGSDDLLEQENGASSSASADAGMTTEHGSSNKTASSPNAAASQVPAAVAVEAPGQAPAQPYEGPSRPQAILKDNDVELHRVQKILDSIHQRWYDLWDAKEAAANESETTSAVLPATLVKPTVMDIIAELKKEVLRDCDIVFSSLIPLGGSIEDSDYFWLACEYGASCSDKLKTETTHLIAAKGGTAKVNAAQAKGHVEVVWPTWLHDTVARWERQPEHWYRLPRAPPDADPLSSEQPTDDELLTTSSEDELELGAEPGSHAVGSNGHDGPVKRQGADGEVEWVGPAGILTGMNWAEADQELEEYLNGSDGDEEDVGSDNEEDSVAGYTTDGSLSHAASQKGKRSRLSSPSISSLNGEIRPNGKGKASSLSRTASTKSNPTGKRRRLSTGGDSEEGGGADPNGSSRGSASVIGTPAGDETGASFMQDLEDEIEAAMGALSEIDDGDADDEKASRVGPDDGGGDGEEMAGAGDGRLVRGPEEAVFEAVGVRAD